MRHEPHLAGSGRAEVSFATEREADNSMLCSSGQGIDDIFKYLPGTQRLRMTRRTLEWRHLAPTAPDTLCEQALWPKADSSRVPVP